MQNRESGSNSRGSRRERQISLRSSRYRIEHGAKHLQWETQRRIVVEKKMRERGFLDFAGWAVIKESTAMNRNRSGRRYDREFKNNAVALVRGGRTITEVARDLGLSKWSLGHWVRQAEEGQLLSEPKTLALETPEQRELRRLRQELEYVSRQRDILKKALGILSAEVPPHASR